MSKQMEPSKADDTLYYFLLTDIKHECYFSSILQKENTFIYCEDSSILQELSKHYAKSKFVDESKLSNVINKRGVSRDKLIVPIDLHGAVSLYQTNTTLKQFSAIGIGATIIDPEWIIEIEDSGSSLKFKEISTVFDVILAPDEDVNFGFEKVNIQTSGLFIKDLLETKSDESTILVVPDFSSYQFFDESKWLKDVNEAISKDNSESKVVNLFNLTNENFRDDFLEFIDELSRSKLVITSRSFVYFICRSMGISCMIYDPWRYVSTSFSRDMSPKASYVRHKRDILKVLGLAVDAEDMSFHISNNDHEKFNIESQSKKVEMLSIEHEEHIVVWGRMPPNSYSGGRYHGWLLAEGLASLGYRVTVYTDNCPYFISDFSHFPGHKNINLVTTSDFSDAKQFPELTANAIIVIPGMDRNGDMYQGALHYSILCDAKIGLINFESPNWFNSLVYPPRDEKLWRFWEITSRFSSLVLSTTQESNGYAKDYYIGAKDDAVFTHLYAPINSVYSDRFTSTSQKEKRVIVFFPRHGYSAHKGWQQVVDCIGDGFKYHTVVFLCGESDLPEEVTDRLFELSKEYQFNIEYKIKIDDEEKFRELSRAVLLVFPSQFEGYGYPPLEALAVGTPCVAFDLPVLRETCGEYLLYAPKGDFETFNFLCNKALRESYRLPQKAVERANKIAHFDSFNDRLKPIIEQLLASDSVWKDNLASYSHAQKHIQKAFFDVDDFLAYSSERLPSKIIAKAIVKEQLAILKDSVSTHIPKIVSDLRIIIVIKNTKKLSPKLGATTVSDYYQFAKLKGFIVDVISEDFALETLREDFPFGEGKFISIGQSENGDVREDAKLAIYKLLSQYHYVGITIVDGFLSSEMDSLQYVPRCPEVNSLIEESNDTKKYSDSYRAIFCHSAHMSEHKRSRLTPIPEFIYPSMDRKKWLVTGFDQHVIAYAEEMNDNFHLFVAGIEKIRANLSKANLKLKVTLVSPNILSNVPYYINVLRVKDNKQLYSFFKRGAVFVNLNSSDRSINSYLVTMAKLVGVCVIGSIEESSQDISWQDDVCSLILNEERWKVQRRKMFNEVLNEIADPNYLTSVFPAKVNKHVRLLNPILQAKKEFASDDSTMNLMFKHNLKSALDKGCLDAAIELSRRASRANKNLAISLITFELSLVNQNIDLAKQIYKDLRCEYPFEGFALLLGLKIHKAQGNIDAACQAAYYSVMLDSGDLQCIADASLCSVRGVRTLDQAIHNILRSYIGKNPDRFKDEQFCNLRDKLLIEALVEEYEHDGNN